MHVLTPGQCSPAPRGAGEERGPWEARALSLSPVSAANLLRDLGPVSLPLQSMEGGAHQWLSSHLQGALSSGQGPWGSGRGHSTAGLMLSLSLPGSLFICSFIHSAPWTNIYSASVICQTRCPPLGNHGVREFTFRWGTQPGGKHHTEWIHTVLGMDKGCGSEEPCDLWAAWDTADEWISPTQRRRCILQAEGPAGTKV